MHVDPIEMDDEIEYGEVSEGHYVTFLRCDAHSPSSTPINESNSDPTDQREEEVVSIWTEIDDEVVRIVSFKTDTSHSHLALDDICGCHKYNNNDDNNNDDGTAVSSENNKQKEERRYATLLVYSRTCQCTRV